MDDARCYVRKTRPHFKAIFVNIYFRKMVLSLEKPAPSFKGTAVINGDFKDISLESFKGKYVVLFFYPLDL